ncbi:MAG: NAD-dependent epimerase/dehydratase family protein [Deltaproteobacteria bacterium]|nr:NAD-dependent epimerase/dehydratase family protein [Deltaproteobacteria bacterium]
MIHGKSKGIAAITGASGMVGSKITQKLLQEGYEVRILTRKKSFHIDNTQAFVGDVADERVLRLFLNNVSHLFHCAAELHNESKMWDINVLGTERILNLIPSSKIAYFCYLSSVGVIGLTDKQLIDERSKCNPQNTYEKSKWAAEQLVAKGIDNCNIAILRPTNVIDERRPGVLALPIRGKWRDRLIVFLKGGECAHIVHAEDVADAAMYFMNTHFEKPSHFIVSCDYEPFNTFSGLWSLCKAIQQGRSIEGISSVAHLPVIVPYFLRRLWRGSCNYGNVRYSSEKLLATGFHYHLGVEGAVRQIVASRRPVAS